LKYIVIKSEDKKFVVVKCEDDVNYYSYDVINDAWKLIHMTANYIELIVKRYCVARFKTLEEAMEYINESKI